jgi:hypothetical protein
MDEAANEVTPALLARAIPIARVAAMHEGKRRKAKGTAPRSQKR